MTNFCGGEKSGYDAICRRPLQCNISTPIEEMIRDGSQDQEAGQKVGWTIRKAIIRMFESVLPWIVNVQSQIRGARGRHASPSTSVIRPFAKLEALGRG